MDTTTATTTTTVLKDHPAVLDLIEIQHSLGIPDADFARVVRLSYSGSSWGKIKAGTFSGSAAKALRAVQLAIDTHRAGGRQVEAHGDIIIFDHIRHAVDAVTVARRATDEHKLVIVCGSWGAGKSVTAAQIQRAHGGHYLHARPSWSSSYLRALLGIAAGIGIGAGFKSVGEAESSVLAALQASPALLIIDEANHFSRDALNFLKTILNETRAVIVLATLPGHLARIAATAAEETRQLLRRAVAIIHIGPVTSADVIATHGALHPALHLGHAAPTIASCANRHARMDTVRRIFEETDPADPEDLPRAIERVEASIKTILQS